MWELADREWGVYDVTSGKSPNLASLLSFTSDLGATEPKDRIYGLIGMIKRQKGQSNLPALLMPGYHRPLAHIYRDAVRYSLQESGTLYPLRSLSHRSSFNLDLEGFPSWVPRYDREWDEKQDPAELADIFDASNGLPICMSDSVDPDVVQLDGILCASVASATEVFKARRGYADATELLAQVETMASTLFDNATDEARTDTIGATLIAGCNMQLLQVEKGDVQAFGLFRTYIAENHCVPPEPHEDGKNSDEAARAATLYWHNLRQACIDRRVFTTTCGRLGVGPKSLRKGDIVAVLYGGITPYVLRPFKHEYQFLGDAYVYGIMNGELVNEHRITHSKNLTFAIR